MTAQKIGLVVNPLAGVGGPLGLHGSDGVNWDDLAPHTHEHPASIARAARMVQELLRHGVDAQFLTIGKSMGEQVFQGLAVEPTVVWNPKEWNSTARDTRDALLELVRAGSDIIVFVGGDGTAREVLTAIGSHRACIGIPAGVKMRSAVFGYTPELTAHGVIRFLDKSIGTAPAEVVDLMESPDALPSMEFFGTLCVPADPRNVQVTKSYSSSDSGHEIRQHLRAVAHNLEPGIIHLIGPGSTAKTLMLELGHETPVLGVDAVCDGMLVGVDLSEQEIISLAGRGAELSLTLGVIGGQGFLLGRGNQQISSKVLHMVSKNKIKIVADQDKLDKLNPSRLWVDLDISESPFFFPRYIKVETGIRKSTIIRTTQVFSEEKEMAT